MFAIYHRKENKSQVYRSVNVYKIHPSGVGLWEVPSGHFPRRVPTLSPEAPQGLKSILEV